MPNQTVQSSLGNQEFLEQLLRDHHAKEYELPPLEFGQSFYDKFIRPLVDAFIDWLNSMFRDAKPGSGMAALVAFFVEYYVYLLVCFLIVAILMYLYRMLQTRKLYPAQAHAAASSVASRWSEEYASAVSRSDWAVAMRIRWKLFAERLREPVHRTPQEFCL